MKTFKALLLVLALASGLCAQQRAHYPNKTIATSGGSVNLPNDFASMAATFEEVVNGSPSTVSIVIKGCMPGGTCDTLDTNTSTSNAIRSLALQHPYDTFRVIASWTGGTSPSVTINATLTTARAIGGGGGTWGLIGGTLANQSDLGNALLAASPIKTATVTLTDAQIKTLPTAGITLVNLSAGQQPVLLSLFYQLKAAGGAYSNVDAGAIFFLQNEDGVTLANDSSGANDALTHATESRGGLPPAISWTDVSNPSTQQIQLWLNNNIAGQQNLTGGNAANTLTVTVKYTVATLN